MSLSAATGVRRICVFCGSSVGARPAYAEAARAVGQAIAGRGMGLVYGGGRLGLMGIVADAALAAGGEVIGVIPQAMVEQERAHTGLRDLRIVTSMHERKAAMSDLAGAFLALPGGFGTLEEFCEMLTWTQLGLQRKPCGILNVGGYYDSLLRLFDHAVNERFLRHEHRALLLADKDAASLIDRLCRFQVQAAQK